MFGIIFLMILFLVGVFLFRKTKFIEHHTPIIKERSIVGYKKKFRIMNDSESALFFELKKQLPQNYYVFPNMRMADLVHVAHGPGFYKRRGKVLPRHADFVICDSDFKPLFVIELNGGYHDHPVQQEKDREKEAIFREALLPLVIIRVGENFSKSVEDILKGFLEKSV